MTRRTTQPRVLLLDRESPASAALVESLRADGLWVRFESEERSALELLRSEGFEVALGELSSGGESVLREALELADGPQVILLDDFGSACEAVEAIRHGAFDCLSRPVSDEQILLAVRRALDQRELSLENRRLRRDLDRRFQLGSMKSADPRMRRVFEIVEAVADTRATLLFEGESGTGKTILARAVHGLSGRVEEPFVEVNCGALPDSLLESELFGHARGAFTGAVRERAGKFETADGGTLFLDEIACASHDLQVKLLRVIEDGCFERVGEDHPREVDVRLICASNRSLVDEVAAGRFRADLYYRIHVVAIELPPLRDRRQDVPLLAEHFLTRYAALHDRPVSSIEPQALERMCAHGWPGNVRELENAIERAVLLSAGPTLATGDLWSTGAEDPLEGIPPVPAAWDDLPLGPLKKVLEIPERALILRALRHHRGGRQATAATLGINRTTLFNKMRRYDLLSFPRGEG